MGLTSLSFAGVLLTLSAVGRGPPNTWDPLLWLLLIGFVQATTLGFSLHLFPSISRRVLPGRILDPLPPALLTGCIGLGTFSLAEPGLGVPFSTSFAVASVLLGAAVGIELARFVVALRRPVLQTSGPSHRPGDVVSLPLFLLAWASPLAASALFFLSACSNGPGFGWWIAGVHLFVLGHATLLVAAVSLRMVPRSVAADPPRFLVGAIAASGAVGSILVPLGMLAPGWLGMLTLPILAAPEGLFAALLALSLVILGVRAKTPRPQLGLHLTGVVILLVGGGIGLWMVSTSNYMPYQTHAALNVLGFLGLTILIMWFGMIAPFQRVSHEWTRKMLWTMSVAWVASVACLAAGWVDLGRISSIALLIGGILLLGTSVSWCIGTLPVLYPSLNPLPGVRLEKIREAQGRWSGRK
ncbi:MAG: hypothetical protein KGJ23_06540 [Euryarchaeota archaeon]|nr:hypothetical protein [Euryarchaeota archaeon]MDE2044981.1 hypothetical protein [Thermoplasmata archaeon]